VLAKVEGRVETDRYGHILMSSPPAPGHGIFQARIAALLDRLMLHRLEVHPILSAPFD